LQGFAAVVGEILCIGGSIAFSAGLHTASGAAADRAAVACVSGLCSWTRGVLASPAAGWVTAAGSSKLPEVLSASCCSRTLLGSTDLLAGWMLVDSRRTAGSVTWRTSEEKRERSLCGATYSQWSWLMARIHRRCLRIRTSFIWSSNPPACLL
jgi:hypothetical protein